MVTMSEVLERFLLAAKKYEQRRRRMWKVALLLFVIPLVVWGPVFSQHLFHLMSYVGSLKLYGLVAFCTSAFAALAVIALYILLCHDAIYSELQPVNEWISKAVRLFHWYHCSIAAQVAFLLLLLRASAGYQPPSFATACELVVLGLCFAVAYLLYVHRGLSSPEDLIVYTLLFFISTTHEMFKDPILRRFRRKLYLSSTIIWAPVTLSFLALPLFRSCEQAISLANDIKLNLEMVNCSPWAQQAVEQLHRLYTYYAWLTCFWAIVTVLLTIHAIILYKIDRCLFRR